VLRTDGPYRLVRHPIYSGVMLLAAGIAATTASVVALIGFAALIGLLHVKARFESACSPSALPATRPTPA